MKIKNDFSRMRGVAMSIDACEIELYDGQRQETFTRSTHSPGGIDTGMKAAACRRQGAFERWLASSYTERFRKPR
jgi:hypothetical protein